MPRPPHLFAIILATAFGPRQDQMLQPTHLFAIIIILAIAFGTIGALFWVAFGEIRKVKVARMQSELHSKLIDKIGSSQEFLAFLESEAGKRLAASLLFERPHGHASSAAAHRDPYDRILASVRRGAILLLLGLLFLIFGARFTQQADGFIFFGGLALALGAGFLASAWISYRLSKKFGLLDRERAAENPLP